MVLSSSPSSKLIDFWWAVNSRQFLADLLESLLGLIDCGTGGGRAGIAPGLVTNSILFCSIFKIKDRCKKVRFLQTHNQGLRQLLLTVSWDLGA